MRSKLHAIAQTFVEQVGSDLQRYTFVFPNHRAGLFFRKYLSQYVDKPMFAPRVMTINECFAELSDLQVADSLNLLLRLYTIYCAKKPQAESLERFIYWGKMMLADFSEIDNHLVPNVEALYASVADLQAIEERFAYLSDNQREALSHFWKEFVVSSQHHPDTELHTHFLQTWDLLYPMYVTLREGLLQDGLAYEGMLHREVLEHWNEIPEERFCEQYVFLGFNALTASERALMLRLQEMDRADFYFDYDSPFLSDQQNRASLFMEENLRLFQSRFPIPDSRFQNPDSRFPTPDIMLVSVPSTVGEVHEVSRILSEIIPDDCPDLTRTAVVLPDEQLLLPLLNSFPQSVRKINVTMGYPLRATSLYMAVAYPEQVLVPMSETAAAFVDEMRSYLLAQRNKDNSEAIYQLTKVLDRLETSIATFPQISFSVADMQQLLKMQTLESTIPYVGEPLDGLQVMGVLETRALDFDNIIITSFNDELYPGRTRSNSFIPYTLRRGFDLPTPERQDAIYAYNFYRMLSYARNVWFITNSTSDEQHSGEVSRYFYQLRWQYNIPIRSVVVLDDAVAAQSKDKCPIAKDERIDALHTLSPTALTTYLRCQKQFYYKYIEHIKEPSPDEDVSASDMTLGNVLHAIMERLYSPFVGKTLNKEDVESLMEKVMDDMYWAGLAELQGLKGDVLAEKIVRSYVKNILLYDYKKTPFQYLVSEKKYLRPIDLKKRGQRVYIQGRVDRIDLKDNRLHVIDYKTGNCELLFESMDKVFGVNAREDVAGDIVRKSGKDKLLQILLYCWVLTADEHRRHLLNHMHGIAPMFAPHIYAAKRLGDEEAMSCIHSRNGEIEFDNEIATAFEDELLALVEEIYDISMPFYPTADKNMCVDCVFAQLCNL